MTVVAVVAVLVIVWVLRLLLVPYTRCWACSGSGRNPLSNSKRHGDCWFCHGTRRRRVTGAKTAHRMWLSWRGKKTR